MSQAGDERARLSRLKPNLVRRALVGQYIRDFFTGQGFLEVETPVRMHAVAPELNIVPLQSEGWLLSTSPELHMKRLLAAGYEKVFQLSRCFRKGERGRLHNPEFTMLEWYRAGADYRQMLRDTEALALALAGRLGLGTTLSYQGQRIDLTAPWPIVTVRQAFLDAARWDPVSCYDAARFDDDMAIRVIPTFNPHRPTILSDFPSEAASLARLKPDDPAVAERAEVFIAELELANAYSELTDSVEQRQRFQDEAAQIEREQGRRVAQPERFLAAIEHLPECGGIALGVDRLVMLFCDTDTIDDVQAFTVDTV